MHKLILKLRRRFHLERDLDDEMKLHLELSDRTFGSYLRIREEARELWTFPFVENLARDLRHACRTLAKSPSFSLVSLFTLGLGIGMNTTVFTLYDALTYRLLPVQEPAQLIRVVRQQSAGTLQQANVSYFEFERLRSGLGDTADLIATSAPQIIFGMLPSANGAREGMRTQFVTGDYFDLLGVHAETGRTFHRDDRQVAVASYTFWSRRLKADPAIVGKAIRLGSGEFTILGIAPKGFYGSDLPPHMPDLWIPLDMPRGVAPGGDWAQDQTARVLQVLGRRKPGVTVQQVSQELRKRGGTETSRDGGSSWLTAEEATAFQTNMGPFRGTGTIALILIGGVAVILLIGCVNLINLTLSRNAARQREIAIRRALGANRRRVVQQLCVESLVLGMLGGLTGLGISIFLCRRIQECALTLVERITGELFGAFQLNLAPDWRVFAYTLALSTVTAALIGIWPALEAAQADINPSLKSEGLRKRQRRLLLTAQIAACFVFLAVAGLLFRGAWQSRSADPGFRSDRILTMSVDLTFVGTGSSDRGAVLRQILARTQSLSEISSLVLVDRAPFLGTGAAQFGNENQMHLKCRFNRVSAGYFDTLEIPILSGRSFSQAEVERGEAEVVVSEAAAEFYWPNENPLGHRIYLDGRFKGGLPHLSYTVVGVAKVVRNTFLSKEDNYYLYFPKPASDEGGWVLMRTRNSPEEAIPSVRRALMEVSPAVASHAYVVTLEEGPVQIQKLMTDIPGVVALLLGVVALLLASIGIYGLVMYLVEQRIREIGIHMAIGAQRGDIVRLVLREGLSCVALGTGIGLLGAGFLSGLLAALVATPDLPDLTYKAGAFDPVTFLTAIAALALGVAAACLLPVWRATRVDPVIALRND